MAEFTVSISEMSNASSSVKNQAEAFRSTASAMQSATQAMVAAGAGWSDDAAQTFAEKLNELKTWCDNMAAIVDTYSTALTTISEKYQEGDAYAASQFKR